MKRHEVIYLCNALDDATKAERKITTDSPAATNKVFGLCRALQDAGAEVAILSMGRGRQQGSFTRFGRSECLYAEIQVFYAAFWDMPFLTHLVTACTLAGQLFRIRRQREQPVLLAYNRLWHYMPTLCIARLLRVPCYLDLEDGFIGHPRISQRFLTHFFDWACDQGALLACEALGNQAKSQRRLVCYGVADVAKPYEKNWSDGEIRVLFGGTLREETGVSLFIQAIRILIHKYPESRANIHFVVTGFGDMADEVKHLDTGETDGIVEFRGAVSTSEYKRLLDETHIGLCLKLASVSGSSHDSTFPSKVIELATHGLLLVSTRVSDVPKVFSPQDALLLKDESPESLAGALYWAITHRNDAYMMAKRGREAALRHCAPERVGAELARFLAGDNFK